jgi:hypothetical protein
MQLEGVGISIKVKAGVEIERQSLKFISQLLYLLTYVFRYGLLHFQLLLSVIVHLLLKYKVKTSYMIFLGKVH